MDKRERKTYYGKLKHGEILGRDIDEEKIFGVRNWKYIKSKSNELKYSLFRRETLNNNLQIKN